MKFNQELKDMIREAKEAIENQYFDTACDIIMEIEDEYNTDFDKKWDLSTKDDVLWTLHEVYDLSHIRYITSNIDVDAEYFITNGGDYEDTDKDSLTDILNSLIQALKEMDEE